MSDPTAAQQERAKWRANERADRAEAFIDGLSTKMRELPVVHGPDIPIPNEAVLEREALASWLDEVVAEFALVAPPAAPSEDAAWLEWATELVHVHRDGIGAKFRAPLAERIAREAAIRAAAGDGGLNVEPHPDEPHDFRTTCLRCGEWGTLHVALITDDEVVTIGPRTRLAHTESAADGSGTDD